MITIKFFEVIADDINVLTSENVLKHYVLSDFFAEIQGYFNQYFSDIEKRRHPDETVYRYFAQVNETEHMGAGERTQYWLDHDLNIYRFLYVNGLISFPYLESELENYNKLKEGITSKINE